MSSARQHLMVYLIRHAEPVRPGTIGVEENERPLSARGRADAIRLADEFGAVHLDALYSSPYPRARQTIEPLAKRRGVAIETIHDLRERLLSPEPLADWRAHLMRSWADFEYAPEGGETSQIAQGRVLAVLEQLAARHAAGGAVALASHGNLIALALNALEPRVNFDFWEAIAMPAVFILERNSAGWRVASELRLG
jgi:2,3-bisphosphoglycerate-dependent phosphoglycerate mutase